jgi:hypothetical protein
MILLSIVLDLGNSRKQNVKYMFRPLRLPSSLLNARSKYKHGQKKNPVAPAVVSNLYTSATPSIVHCK